MSEELKPCPFCHREAQQTLCSGLVSCAYEDCPAFLLAVFPESWNARAQLPSQGGEAVEVVATVRAKGFGRVFEAASADAAYLHCSDGDQLMTVAQHQRIISQIFGVSNVKSE